MAAWLSLQGASRWPGARTFRIRYWMPRSRLEAVRFVGIGCIPARARLFLAALSLDRRRGKGYLTATLQEINIYLIRLSY